MHAARISELLAPFLGDAHLSASQLESISTYIDLLLRWNARINLTAVRDPEHIVTRHFGESLFAARHLFPDSTCHPERNLRSASRIADAVGGPAVKQAPRSTISHPHHPDVILSAESVLLRKTDSSEGSMHFDRAPHPDLIDLGSGAGFPGIPIKIWASHLKLTLIESSQKKAAFLREVCRATTLTNVNVVAARAESFTGSPASTLTLRAVERFESVLPIARGLLAARGRVALLIGYSQVSLARQLLADLIWSDPLPIPHSSSRVLFLGYSSPEPDS